MILALVLLMMPGIAGDAPGGTGCRVERPDPALCESWAGLEWRHEESRCAQIGSRHDRASCLRAAKAARDQVRAACRSAGAACDEPPPVDPGRFLPPVDHPFLPLAPGMAMTYAGGGEGRGREREVRVAESPHAILGVPCVVVVALTRSEDELDGAELGWFAEDVEGNVWQFGGVRYEVRDGQIAGVARRWEAGRDGARPGIVLGALRPGEAYVHEFVPGQPEEIGLVVAANESVVTPAGRFDGCLRVRGYRPSGGGTLEERVYAPGVGLVRLAGLGPRPGPALDLSTVHEPEGEAPAAWEPSGDRPILPPGTVLLEVLDRGVGEGAELMVTLPPDLDVGAIRIRDLFRRIGIGILMPPPGGSGQGEIVVEELEP
jgi:hypothetical protein